MIVVNVKGESLMIRSNHASADFLFHLCQYRKRNIFTDLTISVKGEKISAHKILLSACSPYFENMFTKDFIENASSEVKVVLNSAGPLKTLIDFMYTGLLEVTPENVEGILEVADFLLLEDVRSTILRHLEQTISSVNCVKVLKLGQLYSSKFLQLTALRFIRRNYQYLYESNFDECFAEIPIDEMEELMLKYWTLFIKRDSDPIHFLIESVLKWNEINHISSDELWERCLKHIPFGEEHIQYLPVEYKTKPFGQVSVPLSTRLNQFLIAVAFDSKEIEYLDLDNPKDGWDVLTEIPSMRYGFCGASLLTRGSKIYIIGGVGAGGIIKSLPRFLSYDLETNTWTFESDMISSRKCHGSCLYQDSSLVVVGGDKESSGSVEEYNLNEGKWANSSTIPSLNRFQDLSFLTSLDRSESLLCLAYYSGGEGDWIYEKESGWSRFTVDRLPRNHPGFGIDPQGRPIIAGGTQDSSCHVSAVEVLNNDETYGRRWTPLPKLTKARASPGVVTSNKSKVIYVVGGISSEGSVEKLEEGSDIWEILPNVKLKYPNQEYMAALLER